MTSKSVSKKRKRDSSPEARFELSNQTPSKVGPLLVSFPAIQAPSSIAFKCYTQRRSKTLDGSARPTDDGDEDMFIVGESSSMEFVSNEDESRKVANSGCQYLLALRNKKSEKITLFPSPKSPYVLAHTVKALKSLPASAAPSKVQYLEAKTALGETFGTKKQKANIRAQERNKIDVNAMGSVMSYVIDSIEKGAENLPTAQETQEAVNNNRLIPPFSVEATDPADVYPLHGIIPEAEWKVLPVNALESAQTHRERILLLSYKKSDWINDHLESSVRLESKRRKKAFKTLLYISAMLAFRQAGLKNTLNKEKLYEQLATVPGIVVDSLLSRFAEMPRDSSDYQITSSTKTSLLTHLLALCLKLDNFATDTKVIAHDLSISVLEVNRLFKSLGCKIIKLGERERARLGLSDSTADDKRAVLNAPVEFPKPKFGKKTRK